MKKASPAPIWVNLLFAVVSTLKRERWRLEVA
jgi:hypothetical protein